MKGAITSIIISLTLLLSLQATITPTQLSCEYIVNPQVIDILNPSLFWINIASSFELGQFQTAWEVRVATTKVLLLVGKADLWNSGKVASRESVYNHYNGKPLSSRQDCWWHVRVWDKDGKGSGWSDE